MMNSPELDPSSEQFVLLYTSCEQKLYRFIATLVPVRADAEDLVQETAKVLWKKFPEYDSDLSFYSWACGIAHYEVLNFLSKERTRRKHLSNEIVEAIAEKCQQEESLVSDRRTALQSCLQRLSVEDRQLLRSRYHGADSLAEVATQLGCTKNAIYKSLQKIRRALYLCVQRTLNKEGFTKEGLV